MCEMSVLEGLWGKNADKEGVAGGRVNAQAFSLFMFQFHVTLNIMCITGRQNIQKGSKSVHGFFEK